jgi:hypothetical protein
VTVRVSGLLVLERSPDQLLKVYPEFGLAVNNTEDPDGYHGPAGIGVTVPPAPGFEAVVTWYSVCQFQLILEFCRIVKVTVVPVPVAGTEPEPVHPVHT